MSAIRQDRCLDVEVPDAGAVGNDHRSDIDFVLEELDGDDGIALVVACHVLQAGEGKLDRAGTADSLTVEEGHLNEWASLDIAGGDRGATSADEAFRSAQGKLGEGKTLEVVEGHRPSSGAMYDGRATGTHDGCRAAVAFRPLRGSLVVRPCHAFDDLRRRGTIPAAGWRWQPTDWASHRGRVCENRALTVPGFCPEALEHPFNAARTLQVSRRPQPVSTTEPSLPEPVPANTVPVRAAGSPDTIAPDGSEVRFLLAAPNGLTRASIVEITIQAGQVSRPVRHRTVEEAWYVLEGHGQVWRQPPGAESGSVHSVGPGDTLAIPLGWSFQFAASDGRAMRFLCTTMPPWPGEDEAVPVEKGGLGTPTV